MPKRKDENELAKSLIDDIIAEMEAGITKTVWTLKDLIGMEV